MGKGQVVGYARVSSTGQNLNSQLDALNAFGCDEIFQERKSGLDTGKRPELKACLRHIRKGDVLVVTRLDRLARSTLDLHKIVDDLNSRGIGFKVLEQNFDTTKPEGKLLFTMLSAIAEFETSLRKERQAEGIHAAMSRGIRFGPNPKLTQKQVAELRQKRADGVPIKELMRTYGVGKSSVYRLLGDSD